MPERPLSYQAVRRAAVRAWVEPSSEVSHGLQLQSLWVVPTAAVSLHGWGRAVFGGEDTQRLPSGGFAADRL